MGAEKFIKSNISENLSQPDETYKVRDSTVRLFTISYPENCLRLEVGLAANELFIYGEKLKQMLASKPTKELGSKYDLIWDFQRSCYTQFDDTVDAEKLSYLCKKLATLQKSNAPFKDSIIDFIDILQRGFGTLNASHHNNILSVDLGFSNAQCPCLECYEGSTSSTNHAPHDDVNYSTNLFSFIDENTQFV